jgi:hypothetical protein
MKDINFLSSDLMLKLCTSYFKFKTSVLERVLQHFVCWSYLLTLEPTLISFQFNQKRLLKFLI